MNRLRIILIAAAMVCATLQVQAGTQSAARIWNEALINSIRRDLARPPVHARNLFHTSVAMYDVWAIYDPVASGVITFEKIDPATVPDVEAARAEGISYAAYRIISHRFLNSPQHATTQAALDAQMATLGFDIGVTTTEGNSPAAVGNRVAQNTISFGLVDGSNEGNNYTPIPPYAAANPPLIVTLPGNPSMIDPNRWQEMTLNFFVDQSGNPIPTGYPRFVCPHWDSVTPFALSQADRSAPGGVMGLSIYLDPGPPPMLGSGTDAEFKNNFVEDIRYSSQLTPDDGVMMDIGPGGFGNNPLGTNDGQGYPINPITNQPYAPNIVKRGDFGRIVAEFWADGPASETPPGHWNVLANTVTDSMSQAGIPKRLGGVGPVLSDLEWDVKMYLTLNGATHDAAVACWGAKGFYDWVRPISAVRYLCDQGQSSDPNLPSYSPFGIPLVPGLIELITADQTGPGGTFEHLAKYENEIAVLSWPGPPADPLTQYSGVRWILGSNWTTYQLKTFITPPFAGYFSGHSTFSRSAAEALTRFTGSDFFPGGMGTYTAAQNAYLRNELGPSQDVVLQWARYYDAADEAGISRLYGSIHPPIDDFTGRRQGHKIGIKAFHRALTYFGPVPENNAAVVSHNIPNQILGGQPLPVSITVMNTGGTPWTEATNYALAFNNDSCGLISPDSLSFPLGFSVKPGDQFTFQATLNPAAPGNTCSIGFQMTQGEEGGPFGQSVAVNPLVVDPNCIQPAGATNKAKIKKLINFPKKMIAGQSVPVIISVKNSGKTTWSEPCGFRLGSDRNGPDSFGAPRVDLPGGITVAPGQTVFFGATLTAPVTPGKYETEWQMLVENVEWFGNSLKRKITVLPAENNPELVGP